VNSRERFLSACRQESVDKTPIWFMRQAGRYLPGYKAVRKDLGVIEICKTPRVCKQVTLMPVQELGVDAAVIFADIMLPLGGLGIKFRIEENVGPIISKAISSIEDAEMLTTFDARRDVPFVLEAIDQVKASLEGKTALVGFSGAPFTIASYLIEGQPSRDFTKTKKLMYNDKGTWDVLMSKLTDTISEYLGAQISAGADVVQLFDSWVGALCKEDYIRYVVPYVSMIFKRLRSDSPDIPTIHFATNSIHLLDSMKHAGGEVFSIDWKTPISQARSILGRVGIQGNLEPAVLLSNDRDGFISNRTRMVLEDNAGESGHIFNLGHGILRETPVENAKFVVDYVHGRS
jgi:uroporphyrinogen decarboxylase